MRHDLTSKLVQILGGDLDHRILPFIEVGGDRMDQRGFFSIILSTHGPRKSL